MYHKLTNAGRDALKPRVIEIGVSGLSTILVPSTVASATTELASFFNGATFATNGNNFWRRRRRRRR